MTKLKNLVIVTKQYELNFKDFLGSMVTQIDEQAQKLMRWVTLASVVVAIFLLVLKVVAWLVTDSVSIQASLVDSFVDSLASLVNFFAIRHALRPADDEHRFGHWKIEAVAAQGQSIFIAGTAFWLGFAALQRFIRPEPIAHTKFGLLVIIITIVVTLALVSFQKYVIKKTHSTVIKADHLHFKSDLFLNLSVIASLVLTSKLGWHFIDPLCGLGIGIYIIWTSWKIANEAFNILVDRELPSKDHKKIDRIIRSHGQVKGYHDLKTRSAGAKRFIQLHLELDGTLPLSTAHQIAVDVSKKIHETFPQTEVIIHQDPYDDRELDYHQSV